MRRWARVLVLLLGGALVAVGIEIAHTGSSWAPLAVIGGAIAAGELIELKPPARAALPISFAFMVVLARQATVQEAALVLVVAELATFLVRSEPTAVGGDAPASSLRTGTTPAPGPPRPKVAHPAGPRASASADGYLRNF